ncbi:PAP2-domain-containing protein [Calocera viscosa TUFC12733]|uniref:PAP2-domain-containing protein n=1 Tax=Calocera viscosa (strain TUFC12733) TaxID=1330018 RepID=A0A167G664_CALVF|nr:PAP2-domain-containing protein [Calocera viscosa TUFC12733]
MPRSAPGPWYALPFTKANILVTAGTAAFILLTRSAHAAYFGAGTLVCTLSAKALKRLLRHSRPLTPGSPQPRTYGMPSTHTSAIAFQSLYILLTCLSSSSPGLPRWARISLPAAYGAYAAGVAGSRIWMGHHTLPQVLAGAGFGAVFACGWSALWRDWAREEVARPVVGLLGGWVGM